MEELNFSKILGACSFYDDLNSKTLEYRINGFVYACNFNLDGTKCDKKSFLLDNMHYYGLIFNQGEDDECEFVIKRKYDSNRGDYYYMEGHSKDLNFIFNNYYGKRKIDQKIIDLPFDIYLTVKVNDMEYQLIIQTLTGQENKFVILKNNIQELRFYANIFDFSKVLKIVKAFALNPDLVLSSYTEVRDDKRISFTNTELNKVIENDEKLDKPTGKVKKFIKKITG